MQGQNQTGLTGGGRRKAERRGQGFGFPKRRLSDDPETQWDWLYNQAWGKRPWVRSGKFSYSDELPAFGGETRQGWQKEQLKDFHELGYNPSPGTMFNPAGGTLGGIGQVAGTRPYTPQEKLDLKMAPLDESALDKYRRKGRAGILGSGKGVSSAYGAYGQAQSMGGPSAGKDRGGGGKSLGGASDILEQVREASGNNNMLDWLKNRVAQGNTPYQRETHINAPGDPAGPIGQPQTPMAQAIQLAMEEAALGNFGQYRALMNMGIFGPAGMQSILEQVEGPENQMLADLPGRIEDQINQNAIRGADDRRQMTRGLSLGRAGAQRPGLGAQMIAEATIPQRMQEAQYAGDITQTGYDIADQVSLGQGQRRGDLLEENMKSKLLGLQGMAGATGQAQGMLGERYWDPQSPYDMGLESSSRLAELQGDIGRRAASQGQGFQMYNDRMRNYYAKDQAGYNAQLQRWLENEFKRLGLGQYYASASDWIDAFMPDSISIA